MLLIGLFLMVFVCVIQTLRATHLLTGALWLAGVSVCTSILLYAVGALELAVLELSIGAGLVTVLMVFAISIVGADAPGVGASLPRLKYVIPFVIAFILLTGLLLWPVQAEPPLGAPVFGVLWQQRQADVLVLLVLIFAGVLGVINLLSGKQQADASVVQQAKVESEPAPEPMPDAEVEYG